MEKITDEPPTEPTEPSESPSKTALGTSEEKAEKTPPTDDIESSGETLTHQSVLHLLAASYRGPLPPASELLRYDEVMPGLAERIIHSWESETEHRRSLEQQEASLESKLLLRGQTLAATLATLFFGGSVYLMATGRGLEGMSVVLAEIVALAAVFFIGRGREKPQQDDHDVDLPAAED